MSAAVTMGAPLETAAQAHYTSTTTEGFQRPISYPVPTSLLHRKSLEFFLKPPTPPRFYQQEKVRTVVVTALTLCAGVLFLESGYIAFHGRSSPRNLIHMFWTALGLGSILAGAALAIHSLPPHPNDIDYRNSLIETLKQDWPGIRAEEMRGKYASILDPQQRNQILNAQLASIRQACCQGTAGDLGLLGEEELHKLPFARFLALHPLETLRGLVLEGLDNVTDCMDYLWFPRELPLAPGNDYNSRCKKVLEIISLKGSSLEPVSADSIFRTHFNAWEDLVDDVFNLTVADVPYSRFAKLLANYQNRVFDQCPEGRESNLLLTLHAWMAPLCQCTQDPSAHLISPILVYIRDTLKQLPTSACFNWDRDLYGPLIAHDAVVKKSLLAIQQMNISPNTREIIWTAFSKLCVESTDPKALFPWVQQELPLLDRTSRLWLVNRLASGSLLWKTELAPIIRNELEEGTLEICDRNSLQRFLT